MYSLSHVRSTGALPAVISASAIEDHIARVTEIERRVISMLACDDLFSVQQDTSPEAGANYVTAEATYYT
jgi:hypothetical protein